MSGKSDQLPTCFSCKYDGKGFPCRDKHGNLVSERLGESLLLCWRHGVGSPQYEANNWARECIDELVVEAPQTALGLITSILPLFTEDSVIAVFAAGPLEDLLKKHGTQVIDQVEAEAERNERFRYLLSGIWGGSRIDPEVWRRLQIAVKNGPWLDDDFRTPQGSLKWGTYKNLKP